MSIKLPESKTTPKQNALIRCNNCFMQRPFSKIRRCHICKKDICFSCSEEDANVITCHHCLEKEKDSPIKKSPLKKKKKVLTKSK